MPFLTPFFGVLGSPNKPDHRKKGGTLILTSQIWWLFLRLGTPSLVGKGHQQETTGGPRGIGVLFGCFARKIDGFRFLVYLVVLSHLPGKPSISNQTGHLSGLFKGNP